MDLVFLCMQLVGYAVSVACLAGTVDAKSGDSSSEPSIETFNNKADHIQDVIQLQAYLCNLYFSLPGPDCLGELTQAGPLLHILHYLSTSENLIQNNNPNLYNFFAYIWYFKIFQPSSCLLVYHLSFILILKRRFQRS